jgi:uncharacterized membrane protein HdeD (DUF308 family)
MLDLFARNWWLFAIRGVLAILFGVFAFVQPEITLTVLVAFLAAYLLVDGVTLLISLVRGDAEARRSAWSVGLMGILGIAAGIAAFVWPDITALTLLFVVAFWAISMGVLQVVAAIRLRREIDGELWMAIGGLLSIAFGAFLLFDPEAGLLSVVWLVGIWAVAFGITNLVLAWRLRTFHRDAAEVREAASAT